MGWLSDLFKDEQTSTFDPWEQVEPGLEQAAGLVEQGLARPWEVYGGDLVAGLNPYQMGAIGGMGDWGAGTGGQIADALTQGGLAGYGAGLGGYADVLRGLSGGAPQVGQIDFDYARQIAENPYTDQMITSALRDPYRGLTEQTLPGIDMGANLAGQASGSRAGIAEGIARRGYEDRAADVGAAIRSGAYGQGLNMAQQQAMMNPQLALQGYGQQLNAAGGLAGMGQYGLGTGYGFGLQNLQTQLGAGNILQGQEQQNIDALMRQYYLAQQLPFQQAAMGADILNPMGQAYGTGTQTSNMGLGNAAINIGAAITGASLMQPGGGWGGGSNFGAYDLTGTGQGGAVNPYGTPPVNPFGGMPTMGGYGVNWTPPPNPFGG